MKNMYKLYLLAVIGLAGLLGACGTAKNSQQSGTAAKGAWQANKLAIDGNDSDWTEPLRFQYNKKENFSYSVTNDQTHLYVLLRSGDENTQQRILRGGLTVLFNTRAVNDEHGAAGIVFPTGNIPRKNSPLNGRQEFSNNKHIALSNAQDYSLFGFNTVKTVENYDYGKENAEGIEVSVGLNPSGELVYEAAVPFTALFNRNSAVNQGGKSLAVGFLIDPVPVDPASRGNRGSGVSIGGGLGFGSFGSGGGIGISIGSGALGMGGRQKARKQSKIWQEIILVKAH